MSASPSPLRSSPAVALFLCLAAIAPISGQSVEDAKQSALDHATGLEDLVGQMSMRLWDYSEIALRESQSANYLADLLEEEGFTVERGVAGMPTAFLASYGTGSPILGVLAEYDALPNIGNAVEPRRAAREDGHIHGQGCGHNLFGAGSVAAAIALKRMMEDHRRLQQPGPSPQQLRGHLPGPGGPRRGRPMERPQRTRRRRADESRRQHDAGAHRAQRAHPLCDPQRR